MHVLDGFQESAGLYFLSCEFGLNFLLWICILWMLDCRVGRLCVRFALELNLDTMIFVDMGIALVTEN